MTATEWAVYTRLEALADVAPAADSPTDEGLAEDWGSAERGRYVDSLSMREALLLMGVVKPTSAQGGIEGAALAPPHAGTEHETCASAPSRPGTAPPAAAYPFTLALARPRRRT